MVLISLVAIEFVIIGMPRKIDKNNLVKMLVIWKWPDAKVVSQSNATAISWWRWYLSWRVFQNDESNSNTHTITHLDLNGKPE